MAADRQELALVRDVDARKKSPALAQDVLLLWSMMARGGRENGAKRRNPNRTPNAIPDIQDGVFVKFVRDLSGRDCNLSGGRRSFYLKYSAILSSNISSAGSHFTEPKVLLVSQVAASCSFRCKDSERRLQIKQCIVR